jgi:hypothetical protein
MTAVGAEFIADFFYRGFDRHHFNFNVHHLEYCLKLQKKEIFVNPLAVACQSVPIKNIDLIFSKPSANNKSLRRAVKCDAGSSTDMGTKNFASR